MISKSIVNEGLASIPELWCAQNIAEQFKAILTSTTGPRARGGEDLPDLAEGEVEIARLTLVDSVHGEVTSLRAKRDPEDRGIQLSMVDEYEPEFKLPKSKVPVPLTAEEVLAVFRDADPTPLATSWSNSVHSSIPTLTTYFHAALNPSLSISHKTTTNNTQPQPTASEHQTPSVSRIVKEYFQEILALEGSLKSQWGRNQRP